MRFFPTALFGVSPLRPSKSKVPTMSMAGVHRSGTPMRRNLGSSKTAATPMSRATTTIVTQRTSRLMESLGAGRVPIQHRMAANSSDRSRCRQRGRARFLRPTGRWAACSRNCAVGDALPLGPSAGARRRGRLDQPLDGGRVRGARRRRERASWRSRRALDHAQRTLVCERARTCPRGARSWQRRAGPTP